MAAAFVQAAKRARLAVAGNAVWTASSTDYNGLFRKVKASGADAVYLAGVFDNNAAQLIKDKVAVLGDNTRVKLLGPDSGVLEWVCP